MSKQAEVMVSVIMPVYNSEKYVRESIESVLNQTMQEIELICVDDGSTDASLEILQDYAARDPRVTVLTQPNSGAGTARNLGMEKARGDYLLFLDSDDVFLPQMVEKLYQAAVREDLDVAVCRCEKMKGDGSGAEEIPWSIREELLPPKAPFSAKDIKQDFFNCMVWWPWDKIYKRSFIEKHGLQFQSLRTTNDLYFVVSAVLLAERVDYIEDTLVHQRVHRSSLSRTREKSWDNFILALREVRKLLVEHQLYDRFEQDFINYIVSFSQWQMESVSIAAYLNMYEKMPQVYREFGAASKGSQYFYKQEYYDKLQRVLNWPKVTVSVIMPSLNVAGYMRRCLESVIRQTNRNIEIICVDAGSTDGTLEIIEEYAEKDPRISIIRSDRKSYGYQMNQGMKAAKGEFIGIVETDDFADPEMFERLYDTARSFQTEVVKSNYYRYYERPTRKEMFVERYRGQPYQMLIKPGQLPSLLLGDASIWTGIYQREFLNKNGISFLETPGASYQDTSFILKVWMAAQRVVLLKEGYLHYRMDNENSSIHSKEKAFSICDEMDEACAFMKKDRKRCRMFQDVLWQRRVETYCWNYNRIDDAYKDAFLERAHQDLKREAGSGKPKCDLIRGETKEFAEGVMKDWKAYGRSKESVSENASESIRDKTFITIVVETFNDGDVIEDCLRAIRKQSLQSYEVILADYGSKDRTKQIIEAYLSENQPMKILTLTSSEGRTRGSLRNEAVAAAGGEYILFLRATQWLEAEAVQMLHRTVTRTGKDVILFNATDYKMLAELTEWHDGYNRNLCDPDDVINAESFSRRLFQITRLSTDLKAFRTSFLAEKCEKFSEKIWANDVATVGSALCEGEIGIIHKNLLIWVEKKTNRDSYIQEEYANETGLPWIELLSAIRRRKKEQLLYYSFANAAADQISETLKQLRTAASRKKAAEALKQPAFAETGILSMERSNYINEESYAWMQLILKMDSWAEKRKHAQELNEHYIQNAMPAVSDGGPAVSVIVPVYNSAEYLSQCLDSIRTQTFKNFEVICVDDGSTDQSREILLEYVKKDPRFRCFRQENSGQSVGRNCGVIHAVGKYLIFIDSDDLISSDTLGLCVDEMDRDSLEVLFFEGECFSDTEEGDLNLKKIPFEYTRHYHNGTEASGQIMLQKLWKHGDYWVSPCMQMVSRKHFLEHRLWFIPGIIYEDNYYTLRSMLTCGKCKCIDASLYKRRVRGGSTMTSAASFQNCYGYYRVYMETEKMKKELDSQADVLATVCGIQKSWLLNARNYYSHLEGTERLLWWALPQEEQFSFETMICNVFAAGGAGNIQDYVQDMETIIDNYRRIEQELRNSWSYRIGNRIVRTVNRFRRIPGEN